MSSVMIKSAIKKIGTTSVSTIKKSVDWTMNKTELGVWLRFVPNKIGYYFGEYNKSYNKMEANHNGGRYALSVVVAGYAASKLSGGSKIVRLDADAPYVETPELTGQYVEDIDFPLPTMEGLSDWIRNEDHLGKIFETLGDSRKGYFMMDYLLGAPEKKDDNKRVHTRGPFERPDIKYLLNESKEDEPEGPCVVEYTDWTGPDVRPVTKDTKDFLAEAYKRMYFGEELYIPRI